MGYKDHAKQAGDMEKAAIALVDKWRWADAREKLREANKAWVKALNAMEGAELSDSRRETLSWAYTQRAIWNHDHIMQLPGINESCPDDKSYDSCARTAEKFKAYADKHMKAGRYATSRTMWRCASLVWFDAMKLANETDNDAHVVYAALQADIARKLGEQQ